VIAEAKEMLSVIEDGDSNTTIGCVNLTRILYPVQSDHMYHGNSQGQYFYELNEHLTQFCFILP